MLLGSPCAFLYCVLHYWMNEFVRLFSCLVIYMASSSWNYSVINRPHIMFHETLNKTTSTNTIHESISQSNKHMSLRMKFILFFTSYIQSHLMLCAHRGTTMPYSTDFLNPVSLTQHLHFSTSFFLRTCLFWRDDMFTVITLSAISQKGVTK